MKTANIIMNSHIVLTPTEDLICRYKCHGLQRKEIADKLQRSEGTLLVHFRHIHEKLQINNEVELVVWYIENVLKIEIKKLIQVSILLFILLPSILLDESKLIRVQRTCRSCRTYKSYRSRRSESEADYYLTT